MTSDRYLKAILTVIAIELLWLGLRIGTPAVDAQAAVTPVVIRGVEIDPQFRGALPVSSPRPLRIEALRPLKIEADAPIKIETDKPISVENVPYTPTKRPG